MIGQGPLKLERSSGSWTIGVGTSDPQTEPPGACSGPCENAGMASVNQAPRLYRGISPSERRAQRRERLFEAGLELFGTHGYADSSIRAVCEQASLNSRYFYESFSGREDLLFHVYKRVVEEVAFDVIKATAQAETIEEQARAGLRAALTILTEDPRRPKVIFLEAVGVSERLERLRRDNMHAFADLIVQNSRLITGDGLALRLDPVLTARSLMGAVVDIQIDWINGDVDASVEEIVEHFTKLFTAVAYASVVDLASAFQPAQTRAQSPGRSTTPLR
jgi:AcrR family transcriptional regulator